MGVNENINTLFYHACSTGNGKTSKNQQSKEIKKKDQEPSRNNNNKKYE